MKSCWNCECKIQINAKVCKFCGSVQMCAPKEEVKPQNADNNADKNEKKC